MNLPKILRRKILTLLTNQKLKNRAKRGSREKFERALSRVPDVEPEEHDRL